MLVMGISHSQRLILPRVVALAVSMPLLVVWTDAMALIGGMLAARAVGRVVRLVFEYAAGRGKSR